MRLDIRLPLGLLFVVFGLLLSGFGLVSDKGLYQRSLHVNINLWWGVVMLAFGAVMLLLGRRSHRSLSGNEPGPETRTKGTSAQEGILAPVASFNHRPYRQCVALRMSANFSATCTGATVTSSAPPVGST